MAIRNASIRAAIGMGHRYVVLPMIWLRALIYAPLQWFILALFTLGGIILGLFIVPYAIRQDEWPKWAWLWGNDEEGYPDWFAKKAANSWYRKHWPKFHWYAIENPFNNLRYLLDEPANVTTLPKKANWDYGMDYMELGGFKWRYRYGGWKDSLRLTFGKQDPKGKRHEIYIGPKIGSKTPGVGIAMSWRPAWQPILLIATLYLVW